MWRPHMPMLRGAGSMLGMRGFPPNMMGDGFGFGDGFGMPDLFGVPRGFPPFGGPRFPGDFPRGPMPGMPLPGGPPQPGGLFPMGGLGMMMGPNRGPFMGGMPMGGLGRANRPMGMAPFMASPLPPNSRSMKRDQRRPGSDRYDIASDHGNRGQETAGNSSGADGLEYQHVHGRQSQSKDRYGRSSFQDDESESDGETAPRRARHSGCKKHRGSGVDSG